MTWIRVFAPATIGNIGPGFDVLGLAVKGIGDVVEARKIASGVKITDIESGVPLSADPKQNTAGIAASEVLKLLNINGGVELKIKKGVPIASGLGSSAASAAAAAFATNCLYNGQLTKNKLILPATKAEEFVSGGFFADNTAPALLGGATLTRCHVPLDVTRIGYIDRLKIVLVTPNIKILTKDARQILPKKIPMEGFVSNMANSCLIVAAFAKNDYGLLARSLNDIVIEPVRANLIKGFDRIKKSAFEAGADGVTISGSGPTIFAITDSNEKDQAIKNAIINAFAKEGLKSTGIVTEMEPEGARMIF